MKKCNKEKSSSCKKEKIPKVHIEEHIDTDPLGSYTGVPKDEDDVPVQDVDDL